MEAYRRALAQGELEGYRKRRWRQSDQFASWLTEVDLLSLSTEQALALYRASGGRRSQDFKANPIEEVRDSLDFLLHDNIKLEGRFDECASTEGAYNLAGTGKEFFSYVLYLRNPGLFAVWSTHGERILRRMKLDSEGLRRRNLGIAYMDLLEGMQAVRQAVGLADFRAVDEFAYAVARPGAAP